ncbi:MAG: hypothetical protein AAF638_10685, partial [Pseudomonadota bacterium]
MVLEVYVREGEQLSYVLGFDDFGLSDALVFDWFADISASGSAGPDDALLQVSPGTANTVGLAFIAYTDSEDEPIEQAIYDLTGSITWIAPSPAGATYQNILGDFVVGTLETIPINERLIVNIVSVEDFPYVVFPDRDLNLTLPAQPLQLIEGELPPALTFTLSEPSIQDISISIRFDGPLAGVELATLNPFIPAGTTSITTQILEMFENPGALEQIQAGSLIVEASASGVPIRFSVNGVEADTHRIDIQLVDRVTGGLETAAINAALNELDKIIPFVDARIDILEMNGTGPSQMWAENFAADLETELGVALDPSSEITAFLVALQATLNLPIAARPAAELAAVKEFVANVVDLAATEFAGVGAAALAAVGLWARDAELAAASPSVALPELLEVTTDWDDPLSYETVFSAEVIAKIEAAFDAAVAPIPENIQDFDLTPGDDLYLQRANGNHFVVNGETGAFADGVGRGTDTVVDFDDFTGDGVADALYQRSDTNFYIHDQTTE